MQVRFGPFAFDSETREVRRGNGQVHLSPKAFQLLEALLERRPKALSKSDLNARLWPKTFVVETNLANLVSEIRAVLGDKPRRPRFVRTVHGFGYAFCGETDPAAEVRPQPAPRQVALRLLVGGRTIRLDEGENILGRSSEAKVHLDSTTVSRHHARISVRRGEATLEDLGSKNGTFAGENRVEGSTRLRDGDEIRLGEVRLVFRADSDRESTRTRSRPD